MSKENNEVQETGQEVTTNSKEESATYNAQEMASFIAESKKYRQRAQASEKKLAKFEKEQELEKLKTMEEQEKFKDLANEYKSKYENVSQYKDKYLQMEKMMRTDYLGKLPENIRENYQSTDLNTLQNIVNDFNANQKTPVNNKMAGRFGGYDTEEDLALNDSKAYKDYKRTNLMNFFKPAKD